jgi:hypothetical protein
LEINKRERNLSERNEPIKKNLAVTFVEYLLNPVSRPNSTGISLRSLFWLKSSFSKLIRSPKKVGMSPTNKVDEIVSSTRFVSCRPNEPGRRPAMGIPSMDNCSRFVRSPMELWMRPLKLLGPNMSDVRRESCEISPGIVPVIALPPTLSSTSNGNVKSSKRRGPPIPLLATLSDVRAFKFPINAGNGPDMLFPLKLIDTTAGKENRAGLRKPRI